MNIASSDLRQVLPCRSPEGHTFGGDPQCIKLARPQQDQNCTTQTESKVRPRTTLDYSIALLVLYNNTNQCGRDAQLVFGLGTCTYYYYYNTLMSHLWRRSPRVPGCRARSRASRVPVKTLSATGCAPEPSLPPAAAHKGFAASSACHSSHECSAGRNVS